MERRLLHLATMKFVRLKQLIVGALLSAVNVPSSSIVLKSNLSGKAIEFAHNCIIRIDVSRANLLLVTSY